MEARFLLSVAPGMDKSLFGTPFAPVGPADCYYEAAPALPCSAPGLFFGDSQTQTARFDFAFQGTPSVDAIDGGMIVSLEGEQTWISSGDPVMPVRESTILLPQGMKITSIEARYLDAGTVVARGVQLLAAPAAVPFGESSDFADQPVAFVSSSFSERDAVGYSNHTVCGYNVGTLRIFPIEYDAVADSLVYHSQIAVTVTAGAAERDGAFSARWLEADRERVLELVDNPEMIDAYGAAAPTPAGGSAALPMAGPYEYVIVTSTAFQDSFQPLVSQKTSRGLSATIVTTEYVYANYSGTETGDGADKIRNFIADAYAHWGTRWVLLGGDTDVVPQRGAYSKVTTSQDGQPVDIIERDLPTDLYYACLDGTWNGDGDSRWGESNDGVSGGDVDLMAEVYVGRAPVSTTTEAADFVFKTVQYETNPHANVTTAVWLGEQLDSETWGSYSAIPIRDQCLPGDWSLVERYDAAGRWSGADFAADLNASPHLVNHLGHANETYNARLVNSNVAALTNAHPYFIYSQGCLSGSFDTHDISIAEQHVVARHGAFGSVMNSRYGWYVPGSVPGASHHYALEFWDAVFNEGLIHLGQANQDSKDDNLFRVGSTGVYRWIHFETNLFGDPETPFQIGRGRFQRGEIRGTVYDDANADGQRQPEEQPLADQLVFLDLNDNGVLDAGTVTAASSDVPVAIVDNATVTSTLAIGGAARIADVNVTLDITHTYDSDLAVYLISPSGTRVALFTLVGGWGENFTGTTLDDEAQISIADAAAPFSGTFRPEGLLSRYDGEDPNGTWTLQITDTMAWDAGTLNGWSLEIASEEPHVQTGSDGTFQFQGLAEGTYHVRHELPSEWRHTNPVDGCHVVSVQRRETVQGVDFLASDVPPATELGEIDFLEIADLDLASRDYWYSCQTARRGYLTIEALFQGAADLEITLYDAGLNELAASTACGQGQRIDWVVDAGQTYYFRVTGDAADVDLRLANLVRQDGASVVVYGTDGDDRFEFAAGAPHQLTINGVRYEFASSVVTSLAFDGGADGDTAVLTGSVDADTAVMHPSSATLTGPGYEATVANTASIVILGQGGNDVARLHDSAGDDRFLATPTYARLYGDGFFNQVRNFRYVYARATQGGNDAALLYDSAGDDLFVATPKYGRLEGEGFYNRADRFPNVHGFAAGGGNDVAKLYDSAGDETFVATPEEGKLYGDGFYNRAVAFGSVHAYANGGGSDVAKLYDSAGDDTLVATPDYASLRGDGYENRATSFRYVYACATAGGNDVARLYDSAGDDRFVATPEYGELYGDGFSNRAMSFPYVHAYATSGGNDVAELYDSPGNDLFVWTPEYARLEGDGFYNRAVSFRSVHAYASAGGYDRAYLNDSVGDDHLEASGDTATLSAADLAAWAHEFDKVIAISSQGGSDTKHVELIDYVLEIRGLWTDV